MPMGVRLWVLLLLVAGSVAGPSLLPHPLALRETALEESRVSKPYRDHLVRAVEFFSEWTCYSPRGLLALTHNRVLFDQLLTDYVQFCCDDGLPLWRARHAVLGAQSKWRHVRKHIPRAWDAIRSWHLKGSWGSRAPMPNEVLQAMFLAALSWGFEEPQLATWLIPLAILIRVGYLTLLLQARFAGCWLRICTSALTDARWSSPSGASRRPRRSDERSSSSCTAA